MNSIIKPKLDNREYKKITLDNKLEILLISDKEANMSSASLAVNVGNYYDTVPGLAHFLEHMLFMGTKKYPKENYYQDFLNKNGGSYNAYTSEEFTNYFFDISKRD